MVVAIVTGCYFLFFYSLSLSSLPPCSAKQLVRGEPNVSYICSRYYRAPELIFGATDYTSSIGSFLFPTKHISTTCVSQQQTSFIKLDMNSFVAKSFP